MVPLVGHYSTADSIGRSPRMERLSKSLLHQNADKNSRERGVNRPWFCSRRGDRCWPVAALRGREFPIDCCRRRQAAFGHKPTFTKDGFRPRVCKNASSLIRAATHWLLWTGQIVEKAVAFSKTACNICSGDCSLLKKLGDNLSESFSVDCLSRASGPDCPNCSW